MSTIVEAAVHSRYLYAGSSEKVCDVTIMKGFTSRFL